MKNWIRIAPLVFALAVQAAAQQTQSQQEAPKPPPPRPRTFAETIKRSIQRLGATIDDAKSNADMVVSSYSDPKGGKITIVALNDKRKNLVGIYIYNFGSLKNAGNREEVYRYLLSANDAIVIGSFFVDGDDDIGYKYLFSNSPLNQTAFEAAYLAMATVARERRPEIRKMLGLSNAREDKSDVKKAAEDKPPK
jgi:hypothetical protein